jgi:hypothetical protein
VIVSSPVTTQVSSSQPAEPVVRAISAETMKMPEPIIEPATIIVESSRPSSRRKPVAGGEAVDGEPGGEPGDAPGDEATAWGSAMRGVSHARCGSSRTMRREAGAGPRARRGDANGRPRRSQCEGRIGGPAQPVVSFGR